jgi:hypothetical protein
MEGVEMVEGSEAVAMVVEMAVGSAAAATVVD